MELRIATYTFSGDEDDLMRRAEAGLQPILEAQPGFKSYTVAIGGAEVVSISAWHSRVDAENGSAAVASWVEKNMSEISLIGVRYADIKFSTVLGVTTG